MLEKKKEKNLIFGILQNGNGICHNANRQRDINYSLTATNEKARGLPTSGFFGFCGRREISRKADILLTGEGLNEAKTIIKT